MSTAAVQKAESSEITTAQLPALIRTSAKARSTIAPFLPEGVSLERVAASLNLALAKDRAAWALKRAKDRSLQEESPLERCSPMSVFMAVAKIAQWGLEVGETAHLVPFGAECTPVADYKGLAQLVIQSGLVRQVEAHCVYEKEPFTLRMGTTVEVEHHPIWDATARGKMVGAYAIFRLRGGMVHVKYLGVEEIESIRKRYSKQWNTGKLEPWYAEKTCVRQGVKLLPKDPRLARTLAAFDEIETAELALEVPAALKELASGTASPTLPDERRGPRALVHGAGSYESEAPTPPAQHSDDAGARAEDFQDDRDIADELPLEDSSPARRPRDAMREG
jgi:phage RecT family recombinase